MRLKRIFDVAVSVLLIVLTSPLWIVAAILVKLGSRGPVLHRATRAGLQGRPFTLLKFRTMRLEPGPGITSVDDPRITTVGRWLRRSKIDELPQLVNVLRGEMSLVGPRPEDPRYVQGYTAEQRRVLSVLPGITSPAAVRFRDEERVIAARAEDTEGVYLKELLPAKLALDLDYVDRRSIWFDLGVLVRTVLGLFRSPRR